jgi:hypothetical protein
LRVAWAYRWASTTIHNPFLVPDWGNLRLDLHAPSLGGGKLEAILKVNGREYNLGDSSTSWKSISLIKGNNPEQVNYGEIGFETFQFEIPNELRGNLGTLTLKLSGTTGSVYLDNIFFKSQHLIFGNPSDARYRTHLTSQGSSYLYQADL